MCRVRLGWDRGGGAVGRARGRVVGAAAAVFGNGRLGRLGRDLPGAVGFPGARDGGEALEGHPYDLASGEGGFEGQIQVEDDAGAGTGDG